jgi:hypothetical protein
MFKKIKDFIDKVNYLMLKVESLEKEIMSLKEELHPKTF